MLRVTSRPWAPWYAIPADDKHYQRWQVAKLHHRGARRAGLRFPAARREGARRLGESQSAALAEKA